MRDNNYDYLSSSAYSPASTSPNFRKGSGEFNKFDTSRPPANNLAPQGSSYRKQWGNTLSPNYGSEFKPEDSSYSYNKQYKDIKRLPEEYSSLRATFDTRGNNRIRDMIAKYDDSNLGAGHTGASTSPNYGARKGANFGGYEKSQGNFLSPKETSKYKTVDLDQKLKKYSNTVDQFTSQLETTNKMSEQIKKLKQDRRRRLEAKQRINESLEQTLSSYNALTGSSVSYKSSAATSKTDYLDDKKDYVSKDLEDINGGFRKKKLYENETQYTPKYEKKLYEESTQPPLLSTATTGNFNLDKYKSKVTDKEAPYVSKSPNPSNKYEKYQKYEFKASTPSYTSKGVASPSSKKLAQPVQYVEVNNFVLGRSLGEGKFGIVYQAVHKPTGWLCAIKKVPKQMIKSHLMIDQFILELKLQTYLYHENIVSLYTSFDDKTSLYLVLEYMEEGTLFTHFKKNKTLGEPEVASKIKQIASAVKYLHENEIAHRDIKPENIVMSHGVCKLCDFGWATICSDRRKTYCGTFDYAPPEILEGVEYDYTVDLWCLGVLTYELLVGKAPFYHISRKQTMKKIINVEKTHLEYPETLSKNAVNFIESLIKKDPKQRLSSDMMLDHPFLRHADKPANKY